MALQWIVLLSFLGTPLKRDEIELLECEPPDLPRGGGYGPRHDTYTPGDVVHYYCDLDTYIGGNFYRVCEDTGAWSGDTPVCDVPSLFSTVQQTTSKDNGDAEKAVDGFRTTCSETQGGRTDEWSGNFTKSGQLIRVMLFLHTGPASYEVFLVKPDGQEISCGSQTKSVDRFEWTFHNCPEPHNVNAAGLKIRSLTEAPLHICEIQAYVLTSPKCVDPRVQIESGRLRLDRHSATLVCDNGYTPSRERTLQCVREGVWNRKLLYCLERPWEIEQGDDSAAVESRPGNSDRERIEV